MSGPYVVYKSSSQYLSGAKKSVSGARGGGVLPNMGYIGMCGPKG